MIKKQKKTNKRKIQKRKKAKAKGKSIKKNRKKSTYRCLIFITNSKIR